MSQSLNEEINPSPDSFPLFNAALIEPLQIGGLGVQLLTFNYITPDRSLRSSSPLLPKGFSMKEFHSPKESEDTPQEDVLEVGYVRDVELSR